MNRIAGTIHAVVSDGQLTRVEVVTDAGLFKSVVIDEHNPALQPGSGVHLFFKESDTAVALPGPLHLSCTNRFVGPVTAMVTGKVMTRLEIDCRGIRIAALITSGAAESLGLLAGRQVICFVKSTSLMLDYGYHHGV